MKKQTKSYAIFMGLIAGLSMQSMAFAQDVQVNPEINAAPIAQTQAVKKITPVSQSLTKTPSWQGKEVALRGRDVVSYHQSNKSRKGSKKYIANWDDTTWRFSSAENRDLFVENPERYVPQFGGFCPVALSNNHAKVGLSKHYTVVDEKLYLNYNRQARQDFRKTPKEYIVRAQLNF